MNIRVIRENKTENITPDPQKTVLRALQDADIFVTAPCNGRGTCGKCRIRIQGEARERLACQTYPNEGMTIELISDQNRMEVLTEFRGSQPKQEISEMHLSEIKYMAAVDLGTTTVAIQLLRFGPKMQHGEVVQTIRSLNPQSAFGADVISRITAAGNGQARKLQQCICKLLCESIELMCQNSNLTIDSLKEIVIGGNTTMIHLLRGYDVSGLGKYPFSPVTLEREQFTYSELKQAGSDELEESTGQQETCMVTVMPGISAFVGGDITAGLFALEFEKKEKVSLLIDLGTNGEIALGCRDKILTTSTAAGPAFEGGSLSCGVGSIPGAIKEVTIKKRYIACQTIDNRPAIGICGTGAVDLLAELWTKGYLDEHGSFLDDSIRRDGFPITAAGGTDTKLTFTQEDVRQMQLAKGAIRTGIEILLKEYGIGADQVEHVYLAGGMGFALDIKKAAAIGLLPAGLMNKVTSVGNSCLGGVRRYLSMLARGEAAGAQEALNLLISRAVGIQLAEQDVFTQDYLSYMEFTAENIHSC